MPTACCLRYAAAMADLVATRWPKSVGLEVHASPNWPLTGPVSLIVALVGRPGSSSAARPLLVVGAVPWAVERVGGAAVAPPSSN